MAMRASDHFGKWRKRSETLRPDDARNCCRVMRIPPAAVTAERTASRRDSRSTVARDWPLSIASQLGFMPTSRSRRAGQAIIALYLGLPLCQLFNRLLSCVIHRGALLIGCNMRRHAKNMLMSFIRTLCR